LGRVRFEVYISITGTVDVLGRVMEISTSSQNAVSTGFVEVSLQPTWMKLFVATVVVGMMSDTTSEGFVAPTSAVDARRSVDRMKYDIIVVEMEFMKAHYISLVAPLHIMEVLCVQLLHQGCAV
jgi:hypothetical protein